MIVGSNALQRRTVRLKTCQINLFWRPNYPRGKDVISWYIGGIMTRDQGRKVELLCNSEEILGRNMKLYGTSDRLRNMKENACNEYEEFLEQYGKGAIRMKNCEKSWSMKWNPKCFRLIWSILIEMHKRPITGCNSVTFLPPWSHQFKEWIFQCQQCSLLLTVGFTPSPALTRICSSLGFNHAYTSPIFH